MEKLEPYNARQLSPTTLAFVGDAVFSLYVRERLALSFDFKSGKLSRLTTGYVNAAAQSRMYELVLPVLTEEECEVAKRSRNAHTQSRAKNATVNDYKRASGLEGLLGYLFLSGQADRLSQINKICFEAIDESNRQG